MLLDNLKVVDHPGWQVSERQLKKEMGVVGTKWPDEGLPAKLLGNTLVLVNPKNQKGKRSHRAVAFCSVCGKDVSAGRLHQHLKAHKE